MMWCFLNGTQIEIVIILDEYGFALQHTDRHTVFVYCSITIISDQINSYLVDNTAVYKHSVLFFLVLMIVLCLRICKHEKNIF